jgi:4-diphosphocytidyl-2-C-methyl-D-erythritol kinase
MATLTRFSPAKLNLTLRVLGRRPDGFHDLESLVALVDFGDELTVTSHEDGCYALDCDDPALPRDGSNLVLQAARALARVAGVNRGGEFRLRKRTPAGAGLGGGSSNAATALVCLSELWGLGYTPQRLAQIGAEVGSDVPLFFHGPLCVMRSRGEQVEHVPAELDAWAAILLPPLQCSTPAVYAAWDRMPAHPQRPAVAGVLAKVSAPEELMELIWNDLEAAAFEVSPPLRELAEQATRLAGGAVRVTGSGAALFRLFSDETAARAFASAVARDCRIRTEVARVNRA